MRIVMRNRERDCFGGVVMTYEVKLKGFRREKKRWIDDLLLRFGLTFGEVGEVRFVGAAL
jgi:hypothetical protein